MNDYDKLIEAGIDIEDLRNRLMGNDSLISLLIKKFCEDKNFEILKESFAEKDMKKAEIASHTLKGMCGNLSLTKLFSLFTEQVNHIRVGEYDRAEKMMAEITEIFENSMSKILEWLSEE